MRHLLAHTITDLRSARAVIKVLGLKPQPYVFMAISRKIYLKLCANALRTTDQWQKNRSYTYGHMGLFIDGIHFVIDVKMP